MSSAKLILVATSFLLWFWFCCSTQAAQFSPTATSTRWTVGNRNVIRRHTALIVRGGGDASKKEEETKEPLWSWEEDASKNAPIKIAIGLALFAAKAWNMSLPTAKQQQQPVSSSKVLSIPPPPPPRSLTAVGKTVTTTTGTGTAAMQALVFNLVKAIVGVGVLSLPAGIVGFGNAPSAVLPAVFLVVVMGILSAIGFSWIAQVCAVTGARSYREAWAHSVSPQTSWIPALCAIGKTFTACISYSMVLADSLRAFVPFIKNRTDMLWTFTVLVLLPLCWLKDLKSLVPFSILGVFGMIFTVLAMTYRYLHGSYQAGSPLLREVPAHLQPSFGNDGWEAVFRPQSIVFVSMLSSAHMCHFNAPKFYRELKDNTIPRLNTLTALGFGIAIVISALTAGIGFLTFGSRSAGMVLNNYAPNDSWIRLSRLAVSLSLIFSYPISFQGLRDGVLDITGVAPQDRTNAMLNQSTLVLLLVVTLLASVLTDVSFVVAFGGATLGNLLVYVFPSLMLGRINPSIRGPATLLGSAGVVLGLIGSFLSLKKLGKK